MQRFLKQEGLEPGSSLNKIHHEINIEGRGRIFKAESFRIAQESCAAQPGRNRIHYSSLPLRRVEEKIRLGKPEVARCLAKPKGARINGRA